MRSLFEVYEGVVGGFQGEGLDSGADGDFGGEVQHSSFTSWRVLLATLRITFSS